jgi:hypothetical protein
VELELPDRGLLMVGDGRRPLLVVVFLLPLIVPLCELLDPGEDDGGSTDGELD